MATEMLIDDQWKDCLSSVLISFIQQCTYWEIEYQQLINLSLQRQLILAESLLGFMKHQNRSSNETPRKGIEKLPYAVQTM